MKSLLLAASLLSPTFAADWPQWRGPARDGRVVGFNAPAVWPKTLREEWKVPVGIGHASPVVVGERVYVFARENEEEVLRALDLKTGKEIWKTSYPVAYEMHPAARGHGKGPKSTPLVAGGRVYTLGIAGTLSAHDAKTGRLLWRKDFKDQYPKTSPMFGTAMSPLVEGNLLIAHVGGHDKGALTAFDSATGAVKWSFEPDGPAYSSPVVATLAGTRQVITFTQKKFVGVRLSDGQILWELPAKTNYDENADTPIVYKDTVIFSREDKGIEAIRLTKQGDKIVPQEVWHNEENETYLSTPVVEGNRLLGFSLKNKGQFFAIDADTGKTIWRSEGRLGENAAILNTGKFLLVLTNDATLSVVPTNADSYAPVAKYTVATSPTWAHPVATGTRILVKDETTLASLALN